MPRLPARAGFAAAFLATAMSVTWAGTSVLARLTDTVAVGANTFTTAASFSSCGSPSTNTLTATADNYTFEDSPGENFGGTTDILVDSNGARDKRTLVNFTLPTVPAGCSITSSTLKFTTISGTTARTLQAYRAATSWTETTSWWSNQPATTGTAATATSSATVDAVISWTVTAQVQAMYPSSMFGFVVKDSVENGAAQTQTYHSRTSASTTKRPTLVVVIG